MAGSKKNKKTGKGKPPTPETQDETVVLTPAPEAEPDNALDAHEEVMDPQFDEDFGASGGDVPEIQARADESAPDEDQGREVEPELEQPVTEDAVLDPAGVEETVAHEISAEAGDETHAPEVLEAEVVDSEPEFVTSGPVLDAEIVPESGPATKEAEHDQFAPTEFKSSEQPVVAKVERTPPVRAGRTRSITADFQKVAEDLLTAIRAVIRYDDLERPEVKRLEDALTPFESQYEQLTAAPERSGTGTGRAINPGTGFDIAQREFGVPATALCRYLGSKGYTAAQAKERLAAFGILPSHDTVRSQVDAALPKNIRPDGSCMRGKIPALSPDLAAKLEGKNGTGEEVTTEAAA